MNRKRSNIKLNNSGAALVMVVVVIAFVSIFATIVLYMSGMNYYMKATDMSTRKSFYNGEKALELIKSSLMEDASLAYKNAYMKIAPDMSEMEADEIQTLLNKTFSQEFAKIWNTHITSDATVPPTSATAVTTYLKTLVGSDYAESISVIEDSHGLTYEKNEDDGTYSIKTAKIYFTDSDGYTTIIETEYQVSCPQIEFSTIAQNPSGSIPGTVDNIKLIDCVQYKNWTKE